MYKNYNASVTFGDGQQMSVNANNMIVKEIPQILVELDPKYNITDNLNVWLSFRYFGKLTPTCKRPSTSTAIGRPLAALTGM